MRHFLTALPIALSLALTAPALADTRDERLAIANAYVDSTLRDLDMEALIRTMWQPIVDQATAQGQEITEEQRDKIQALFMETYSHRVKVIMESQGAIMADTFTLQELQKLRDFYATPEGRSIMEKMPRVMQTLQPQIVQLVQQTLPELMPKLKDILKPKQ